LNVFLIRLTSFPILLAISFYERQSKKAGTVTFYATIGHVTERIFDSLPRSLKRLSIFEGLAGADADIDAVFEIENQYESALDTNDITDDFSLAQRRLSGDSLRREHQFARMPRIRLSSGVNHPPEFQPASPLAQVFNPIVMDDPRLDPKTRSQNISFGLATRRRTTSMLPTMQTPEQATREQLDWIQPQTFPSRDHASPSNSPMLDDDVNKSRLKETIIKADDELENGGLDVTIIHRLDGIEQRQQRIEDILLQLSQSISRS